MLSTVVSVLLLSACLALPTDHSDPTITETDCSLHRSSPENTNTYEMFVQRSWEIMTCKRGLVWEQNLCECVYPPVLGMDCQGKRSVNGNPRQYEVQIWGSWGAVPESCDVNQIWNQTFCRCDWDPEGPGAVERAPSGILGLCIVMVLFG